MTPRLPRGAEAQCGRCARFFGSDSAFDRHLTRDGCANPADVRNRKGEVVLRLVERHRGPTWVGAGESPFAVRRSASRQEETETPPAHSPVPDVIECWLCPSPTVGDSDYCADHKGVRA